MWLISFSLPSISPLPLPSFAVIGTWSHVFTPANFWSNVDQIIVEIIEKYVTVVSECTCTTLPPVSNHKQSIHPPALSSYLYSNVPSENYLNRLSNSETRPNSSSTHPQDSSAPLKYKYLNKIAPLWQGTTLTPRTPPYRMAEEVRAILALSNAQRSLSSNDRCRQCEPRRYSVSFHPLRQPVSITRAFHHLFWALSPVSRPHHRPGSAPRSSIPRWYHAYKNMSLPATRMAKLLVKAELETKAMAHTPPAWVWLGLCMIDNWLILMIGCSAVEQGILMEVWSHRAQEHHMIPMLCLHLRSGARRTPITPGWVIFGISLFSFVNLVGSFLVQPFFPIFWSQHVTSSSQSINEGVDLTDQKVARRFRKRAQGWAYPHRPQRARRRIKGQDWTWKEEDLCFLNTDLVQELSIRKPWVVGCKSDECLNFAPEQWELRDGGIQRCNFITHLLAIFSLEFRFLPNPFNLVHFFLFPFDFFLDFPVLSRYHSCPPRY